ncbi:GNAT family N-acetyltransferase [Deinococcus maricopensis]|uniref:GCN5-related N-acetyltransferase n=1 Tax=Deinococcus maricopensis (strain DSM 21211 / LMG 22137 / NRRL B-23946 / LB-34) TaxID=709986 RepID=E8U8Q6_DEIML|nr:GNAT family N-acetyltransferase [Deinococcus maricopensis]ADV67445.1 GCN5-related N-acetyltransferase [Deinococcus maricopensis DSM 21211]
MTFRSFTPQDRAACLALFDSNTPPFFDSTERALYEDFLHQPEPYFVLEDDTGIVACGGLWLGAHLPEYTAGLSWAMVRRDQHGQGIGAHLLNARLDWLRTHRPDVQQLYIDTSHLTQGYYERHGFRVTDRIENGFAPGMHQIKMTRPL